MFRLFVAILMAAMAVTGVTLGSMAAFTDSDTDTGTVTAGSVDIAIETDETSGELSFNIGPDDCPGPLAPGDSCDATFTVTNQGTLPVTISGTASVSSTPSGCFTVPASLTIIDNSLDAAGGADDEEDITVTVTLDGGAPNTCQSITGTVTVTVDATST